MQKLDIALCQWTLLYIHYFNFLIFMHFTNQITLQQSLTFLNLIFKVSQTRGQINIPLWTHMGHKEWRHDGKGVIPFTGCCHTIALKFWDEFNANFVLFSFSSYRSKKVWHLYFKNVKKNAIWQCIKIPKYFQF